MDLSKCKKNDHPWEAIFNTEAVMDNGGERVEWCALCGSIRVCTTFDWRIIDTTVFKTPQAARELEQIQRQDSTEAKEVPVASAVG